MQKKPVIERFLAKVDKSGGPDACWLWTCGIDKDGYGKFWPQRRTTVRAHRFAYANLVGPVPNGLCVLHRCDVPACVNPAHLSIGTNADNTADMVKKGRAAVGMRSGAYTHPGSGGSGERHGMAKLTAANVVEIRRRCASGEVQCRVAASLNVSESMVSRIVLGKNWVHVA